MTESNEIANLSPAITEEIDSELAKFPKDKKQSAIMAALRIVQAANGGHLTIPLMDAVTAYLELPKVIAYEIATFYSMYELEPCGRNKLEVCTNISCKLRGSDQIIEHLEGRLGIKVGETTADQKFSLRSVECLGACVGAPMMQVGEQYIENLTPEKLDEIIASYE